MGCRLGRVTTTHGLAPGAILPPWPASCSPKPPPAPGGTRHLPFSVKNSDSSLTSVQDPAGVAGSREDGSRKLRGPGWLGQRQVVWKVMMGSARWATGFVLPTPGFQLCSGPPSSPPTVHWAPCWGAGTSRNGGAGARKEARWERGGSAVQDVHPQFP